MVTVTESAREMLKRIGKSIEDPGFSLRLACGNTSGQYIFMTDIKREGDQVIEHEGKRILLIGNNISYNLDGAVIDCSKGGEGQFLTISRE